MLVARYLLTTSEQLRDYPQIRSLLIREKCNHGYVSDGNVYCQDAGNNTPYYLKKPMLELQLIIRDRTCTVSKVTPVAQWFSATSEQRKDYLPVTSPLIRERR
ncbi:hypothetical protein AVEN_31316-1 [Araneus ventricosus]|uniref:Uncharacterized protein n=1 Tax=Araneus ventricosus TaxID=182803 RepID=A0A4Y2V334_ARAVE|nr:hypothetical protein AVEN_31316-1 [Araneus ventricosus]